MSLVARRVQTHVSQQEQGPKGDPLGIGFRATPVAIRPLESKQLRAPSLHGHLRALGGDDIVGRIGQVAQHLPADRRIGVQQPVDDVHAHMMRYE